MNGCHAHVPNLCVERKIGTSSAGGCTITAVIMAAMLKFASIHVSMPRNQGGKPCPGWTPTASAFISSLADNGPSVVLLHEMGGTLDSWDGIFPALSERFRTLRYDQRGSGLSEKVRQPITTEILEEDLEAVLQESGLPPPYHFVTVAAATMQALIYMTKHPDRVASFVFCNPFTGADPSRVAALEQRADLAEREGLRKAIPTTLDKSWPPDIGDPRPTRPIAGATWRTIRSASPP